jgi:thiol-disulfide isomerase/thioredoxin
VLGFNAEPIDRGRRALLAVAAGAAIGRFATAAGAPEMDLDLLASDGRPVLAAGAARATYVDFWASWCAPCRLSFPWMNEMHDRYAALGLRIVAIGLDRSGSDARRFLLKMQPRFAVALDPGADSARRLDVQAMPSSYLFSAELRLLFSHRGFRLDDRDELERRFQAALR